MAMVRIPAIVVGMSPFEYADEAQQSIMDDAINAMIVAMVGEQSLDMVCDILRWVYQRDIEILRTLDERFFQPSEYVYERTKGVIEHCEEHSQELASRHS